MLEDKLFDTPLKRQIGTENLRSLVEHPGWKLYVRMIEANISVLNDQILEGSDEEDRSTMDRLRDKRKIYQKVINLPAKIVREYGTEEEPEDDSLSDSDPYPTVADLDKNSN